MKKIILGILIMQAISFSQGNPDHLLLLSDNWQIQSSEKIKVGGDTLSSGEYIPENWYTTMIPSTVLGTLVRNNVYKDIFYGENLKLIPDGQFKKSWWYRNEFVIPGKKEITSVKIKFDGINYRANIWMNGKLIAGGDSLFGAFRQFELDITAAANIGGNNILAVEVIPPVPGDFTIGFVDWNPEPPDRNMGIWREVKIKFTGDVSINFPFVNSMLDLENFQNAELTISSEIINNCSKRVSGTLSGEIDSIKFSKKIELDPNEIRRVTFMPEDFDQLKIKNPRIWWTHNWGTPELYNLKLQFKIDKQISDESQTTFGIRKISDYINEQGHRGYKLNGKKILITGGGWVDHLLLEHDYKNLEAQIQYVKHIGLNTIRLEGIWGNNEDLYNLCDKYGILLMVGWSCQWEWDNYIGKPADDYGAVKTPEDIILVTQSWKDQVKWLRNHPAIFVWMAGSDKLPRPELEREYLRILNEDDPTRPYLSSAKQLVSEITGSSAVKMNGPYEYVPPIYWSSDTQNGGAFGFNTETGPGPQVPPMESILKMIPENHLWPIDSVWDYHCGRNQFNTLDVYNKAMNNRLGKPGNLNDYTIKAQYLNYEGMRGMFEAFTSNKPVTTGIIQWMLNASWPKLWWQLYDYYLMPNGAFYGAKKALEPLHIQYNYYENAVYVVNNTLEKYKDVNAKIRLFNADSLCSIKFSHEEKVNLVPDVSHKLFTLPDAKLIEGLSSTYFLDLRLYDISGKQVSSNLYSLSVKPESVDYEKTEWYYTPVKEYADLSGLDKIKMIDLNSDIDQKGINIKYEIHHEKDQERIDVEIINNSAVLSFQLELILIQGKEGEPVLPVFWDDNYFSLFPSEQKIISVYYKKEYMLNPDVSIKVRGWNLKSK